MNNAGVTTSVRTSRVARAAGSVINGKSTSSSIGATPELLPDPIIFVPDLVVCRVRRPVDARPARRYSRPTSTRAVAPIQGRVQRQPQARDGGDVDEVRGAARKHGEAFFRRRQIAGQKLALGPVVLEREGELVLAAPKLSSASSARPAVRYLSAEA